MTDYSIWLVETGTIPDAPRGNFFYGAHNAGTMRVPLGFVVVKGEGHLALIDTGFRAEAFGKDLEALYGARDTRSSHVALLDLGLEPDDVDTVVLTHAHWDHMGNVRGFPNATIHLQASELERWTWALELPDRMGFLRGGVDPEDFAHLLERSLSGSVRLHDGDATDILPGIDLLQAHDTHTYGSQLAVIHAADGPWVATGDAVFTFRNLTGIDDSGVYVPIGQATGSQQRILESYERIREVCGGRLDRIVPIHDEEAYGRFPSRRVGSGHRIAEVTLALGEPSRIAV